MKGRNNNEHGSTSTQAAFTYKRKFSSASVYIVFSCCKTDKRTGGPDETANKIASKSIPIKCGDYSCSVRSFIIISDARRVFLANASTSFVYTISQSIDSTLGYVKKRWWFEFATGITSYHLQYFIHLFSFFTIQHDLCHSHVRVHKVLQFFYIIFTATTYIRLLFYLFLYIVVVVYTFIKPVLPVQILASIIK